MKTMPRVLLLSATSGARHVHAAQALEMLFLFGASAAQGAHRTDPRPRRHCAHRRKCHAAAKLRMVGKKAGGKRFAARTPPIAKIDATQYTAD